MIKWLNERVENVYKKYFGYDVSVFLLMVFEVMVLKWLFDVLRGELWVFVVLFLVGVREEME